MGLDQISFDEMALDQIVLDLLLLRQSITLVSSSFPQTFFKYQVAPKKLTFEWCVGWWRLLPAPEHSAVWWWMGTVEPLSTELPWRESWKLQKLFIESALDISLLLLVNVFKPEKPYLGILKFILEHYTYPYNVYHDPKFPKMTLALFNTGVNFTNVLWAAFVPKSFCQKITNPNCTHIKAVQKNFHREKMLRKYWWNLHLKGRFSTADLNKQTSFN